MDNPISIDQPPGDRPFQGLKVAILYSDAKREYFATEEHYLTEAEVIDRAKIIAPYFEKMGAEVFLLPGDEKLSEKLLEIKPSLALNLVDSIRGQEYLSASIPGVLELLNIPYTGAGILSLSIDKNKFLIKKMLEQYGLPVPRYQLIVNQNEEINPLLRYPLISKINAVHGSVEIDQTAVSESERHLKERIKRLMSTYREEILVEEYIGGRELTAMIFEGHKRKVYLAEKLFHEGEGYNIATFAEVWGNQMFQYTKFEASEQLKADIKMAYEVLKMEDYGKIDLRIDLAGRYYFIDSNVNPSFGPKEAGCSIGRIMDMHGVDFPEILKRLVQNTLLAGGAALDETDDHGGGDNDADDTQKQTESSPHDIAGDGLFGALSGR